MFCYVDRGGVDTGMVIKVFCVLARMCSFLVGVLPEQNGLVFLDLESGGLDKSADLVSVVGVLWLGRGLSQFVGGERELLLDACAYFDNLPDDVTLVTFNGINFDLPFVRSACERHRIPFFLARFKHVDLMPIARIQIAGKDRFSGELGWISKDRACDKLGIYVPKTVSGFKCALIARSSRAEGISGVQKDFEMVDVLGHNAIDLVATAKLFEAFQKYGWVDSL